MFDTKFYIDRLREIRARNLWTWVMLANAVGLSFTTLKKFMDDDESAEPVKQNTLRKIRDFVDEWED